MEAKTLAYKGGRSDVLDSLLRAPVRVLDVGCSDGSLGAGCLERYPESRVIGVEQDLDFAAMARDKLQQVIVGDIEKITNDELPEHIDTFFLADVLEHTRSPDIVLQKLLTCAVPGAQFVISLPNVQHWTAIANLLRGEWPERERGLFDSTHLRFFTLRSIRHLLSRNCLEIRSVRRNYRLFDSPDYALPQVAQLGGFWPLRPFFTYQYVVAAEVMPMSQAYRNL